MYNGFSSNSIYICMQIIPQVSLKNTRKKLEMCIYTYEDESKFLSIYYEKSLIQKSF